MTRGWLAAAIALSTGLSMRQAAAQDAPATPLKIVFEAPEGCPGGEHVTKEVRRLLGPSLDSGPPLSASGTVKRDGDKYTLDLSIDRNGERSVRRLESRSCETAADVAALLISLAHSPDAVGRETPPPDPPPPVPEPPKPPPPAPPVTPPPVAPQPPIPAPRRPEPKRSLLGWLLRAGPLFGAADLPFPQVGGQVAVALRIEAWTVEAGFEAGFSATHIIEERPDAGANFLRLVGVLRGCRVLVPFLSPPWPRPTPGLDLSACIGFEAGQLEGETFGVFQPETATVVWLAPQLDLRLGIGITPPLSLVPHVGLAFPITRPSFVITANEPQPILIHQPGPVAGRAGVTFEAQF
jgi:hypothetical protein